MEIKLTNVARASLEELLADYRDFLRTRGLTEWVKERQRPNAKPYTVISLIKPNNLHRSCRHA
jgi:hypothetical protein